MSALDTIRMLLLPTRLRAEWVLGSVFRLHTLEVRLEFLKPTPPRWVKALSRQNSEVSRLQSGVATKRWWMKKQSFHCPTQTARVNLSKVWLSEEWEMKSAQPQVDFAAQAGWIFRFFS